MTSSRAALPGPALPLQVQLCIAAVLSEGHKVHVCSPLSACGVQAACRMSSIPSELVYGGFQLHNCNCRLMVQGCLKETKGSYEPSDKTVFEARNVFYNVLIKITIS